MYRKILVALENSDADASLLPHIAELAGELKSSLLLVHVADGWAAGLVDLEAAQSLVPADLRTAAAADLRVAQAAQLHFASVANQARFIMARDELAAAQNDVNTERRCRELIAILNREIELARRLFELASADSRIGYEASNHYFYVPLDLVEKVVSCDYLRTRFATPSAEQDKQR